MFPLHIIRRLCECQFNAQGVTASLQLVNMMTYSSTSRNISSGTLNLQDESSSSISGEPPSPGTNASTNDRRASRRPDRDHRVSSINSLAVVAAANRASSFISRSSSRNSLESGEDDDDDFFDMDPHARAFTTAIRNAGTNAFGINAIDVWLLNEEDGSFRHAPGGWWRHYAYTGENAREQTALARIEDGSRPDHVPPTPQIPGAGLAGYFWGLLGTHNAHCVWRDVKAITSDPDQPAYPRMQMLEQAGFGKATGVPFDIRGHRGIVLYLTRETASEEQLTEKANDAHLRVSADLIGCLSANAITQEACIGVKQTRTAHTLRRVKAKITVLCAFSSAEDRGDGEDDDDDVEAQKIPNFSKKKSSKSFRQSVSNQLRKRTKTFRKSVKESYREGLAKEVISGAKQKAQTTAKKCKGGGLQPPPPMPWWQVWWTFLSVFTTLVILVATDRAILHTGYGIVMGPFGALMTLQYGLTPAPAAQPRNALYGQTISISIALLVKLATATIADTSKWIRIPLATALSIATMTRLGITHPPAGASAALFAANERLDGIYMGLMLFGNIIAVITATLFNNLNAKRQYPIYWRMVPESWTNWAMGMLEDCVPYFRNRKMRKEDELRESERVMKASLRMSIAAHKSQIRLNK